MRLTAIGRLRLEREEQVEELGKQALLVGLLQHTVGDLLDLQIVQLAGEDRVGGRDVFIATLFPVSSFHWIFFDIRLFYEPTVPRLGVPRWLLGPVSHLPMTAGRVA